MGDKTTTRRPAVAASGTLAKTPFLHLLIYALDKKLTGSIELFTPDKRNAVVLFLDGQPCKMRTSESVAYLGHVLRELGHLTDEQLKQSLAELAKAKAARPMLHGEYLVGHGVIDGAKLKAGLREQLARKLRWVAAMPAETAYAYYDAHDSLQGWGGEGEAIDPVPLFWEMLREYAPWEHVSAAMSRISMAPLRLARGAELQRLRLKNDELAAAQLLRERPMRPTEFAHTARLKDRTGELLAYLLLVTKQVDVLAAEEGPAGEREEPTGPLSVGRAGAVTAPNAEPSSRFAPNTPAVPPPTLSPELAERWREIVDRAATIDRADYFMMLDLARDASPADVEAAFFGLVRRWHPDRLPPELAPIRDACSRVFARMSEAHVTLTDEEPRSRYMRLLADGSGSPETQASVAKVIEAATAFQKAEVCFRRNDFVQAEMFCRKALEDDPTQPDYHAMLAWMLALKPENQSPEKTLESIHLLERAIAMSNRCEKAFLWRGMLFKRLGRNDLAVKDFKRAMDLNPRNIDAAREVRLYNMRGGPAGRSSKPPAITKRSSPVPPKNDDSVRPGILGRLFKKP
jgi:hypothetical protein